jgi:hypothetical protein
MHMLYIIAKTRQDIILVGQWLYSQEYRPKTRFLELSLADIIWVWKLSRDEIDLEDGSQPLFYQQGPKLQASGPSTFWKLA